MNQQELFITMALQSWNTQVKRTTAIFDGFTDEELQIEVAPGKNRIIYLLGHLAAVNDAMLPLLGFGGRQYPQLDEAFITHSDREIQDLPGAQELRAYWSKSNEMLNKEFAALTIEGWFQKHTVVSEEDFVKEPHRNKLNVLLGRTNHLAYHLGQLALVKK